MPKKNKPDNLLKIRNLQIKVPLNGGFNPTVEMNMYQPLSFKEIATNAFTPLDLTSDAQVQKIEDKAWGVLVLKTIDHPHVTITEYKASLNGKYEIHHDVAEMLHSMNICMVMQGEVGLTLKESKFSTNLTNLQHHNVYSNETAYALGIDHFVNVVHLAVDLGYYANLLCEHEHWTAGLKEKILNKELVCNTDGQVGTSMKSAVQQILNNDFTGNAKTLLVESKMLEIVALQLNEFANQNNHTLFSMRSAEVDIFHDLKNFLDQHFTDDLSLKSLSKMFGLNEFKLKKGFKELFESTVFEYIHELKMNYSRHLLRDHHMYVNEVASKIVYKNPHHFSTAFKRKFGITPKALK